MKAVLAIALLGLAVLSVSGYKKYDRDRYIPPVTETATITIAAPTPTPMYTILPDLYQSCINILPNQKEIYVRPNYEGKNIVIGDKNILYLVGKPNRGKWEVLFPGGYFPADFNSRTDQFWRCQKPSMLPVPTSPTP